MVIMSGVMILCYVMSHCDAVRRPRDLGGAARVHEDGVQVRVACHVSRVTPWQVSRVTCHTLSRVTRAVCRTVRGEYRRGKPHCAWTSCREGCTHEVYTCWQIEVSTVQCSTVQYSTVQYSTGCIEDPTIRQVEYNIYDQNQSVVATAPGKLFPNVKGCGYPPIVDCDGNNVSRAVT